MQGSTKSQTPTPPPPQAPVNGQAPPQDVNQEGPARGSDALREISRLLRGEPATPPPDDQGDQGTRQQPPGAPPKREFKSLDEVAKALQVDVSALYDLEVPLRTDQKERKKLGELKDYFAGQDQHSVDRLAWEEQRATQQAELNRSRMELAELLRAVPQDKLNAEVIDAVRKKQDAVVKEERRKTLDKIPEWRDDDTRARELSGMVEHLADYGLPAETLQGIVDHRMLAYVRDNWLRTERLRDALQRVQPVRTPTTPPRSKSSDTPPTSQPVRPSQAGGRAGVTAQVSAISKLLRG
jgi:hypothetical protein